MKKHLFKYDTFGKRRSIYFQQLLSFYSDFRVWSENKEWRSWFPIKELNLDELMENTLLHREILPNEWVFDLDGKDWEAVRSLALSLEQILEKHEIPFNRWSSGNFLHYHIFLDDSEIVKTLPDYYWKLLRYHFGRRLEKDEVSVEEIVRFQRQVFKAIPLLLLEELEQTKDAYIDLLKFSSSRCLIRAEGSLNPKTKAYKTYLEELPLKQPLVRCSWKVKFPKKIEIWKPDPEFYDRLFLLAYWYYIKSKYPKPTSEKPLFSGRRKGWIERLLQTPLPDGRHRAVNLIFAPYFINILRCDEGTALNKIMEWLKKCCELRPTNITQHYVIYQLRYARRRQLNPLGRKKALEVFADVEEIKRVVT